MKCKYCNAELKQGAKFCPNCGKEASDFDVCVSCGKQIKIGASFCPHCGASQKEKVNPIQEIENDKSEVTNVEFVESKKQEEIPVAESHEEVEEVCLTDEEDENSKKWLWTLVAVLLIGIGGGGFYFWKTNMGSSLQSVNNPEETVTETGVTDLKSVEAINARLTSIFSEAFDSEKSDNRDEDYMVNKFFSKEYRELFAKVKERDKCLDDELMGFWGMDCIWDCEVGYPDEANIISINYFNDNDTEAYARVKFIRHEISERLIVMELILEDGNWYIDDINESKQAMQEYIQPTSESIDLVGKVYKGEGSLGHTGIQMTISFFADYKCLCASDWYQEYPEPKDVTGSYEIKEDKVIVHCNKYEFVFDIAEDGRVLTFYNGEEMDTMTLELVNTED